MRARSHQKKGGHGHARPSFFWYDDDLGTFLQNAAHILSWLDTNFFDKFG